MFTLNRLAHFSSEPVFEAMECLVDDAVAKVTLLTVMNHISLLKLRGGVQKPVKFVQP